jgi:hypothetical protein
MDTIIFLLILCTLLAMRGPRWLVLVLFTAALTATVLLFNSHATSHLSLNF